MTGPRRPFSVTNMTGNAVRTEPERAAAEPVASPLTGAKVRVASHLQPLDRRIFAVAAALFALLMVFSAGYGFDRDELYFLT